MEPQDREEAYLANAAGDEVTLPACPWNRKEAYLADIGDRLDGIDNDVSELNQKVAALATDFSYKGSVADYAHLPSDAAIGDVYTTEDKGEMYVWDGTQWQILNMTGTAALTGDSDPTTSTEGEPGQLYLNTTSSKLFYCTGETSSSYTWLPVDTTYSAFTGATASTAGAAGLVPAPAAGDESKVLKGDGTWAVPEGGTKTLTTADYNYPTNNPTQIALWLLPAGVYKVSSDLPANKLFANTAMAINQFSNALIFIAKARYMGWEERATQILVSGLHTFYFYQTNNQTGADLALATIAGQQGLLKGADTQDNLTSTSQYAPLSANQGKVLKDLIDSLVIKNAGAPTTSTTGTKGQLLEDTTNGNLYICTNSASPYAWKQIDKDEILTNAGAPTTSTAGTLGQLLTDTTNAKLYQLTAIDTTDPQNPSYTWTEVGGSAGPTVVQTTGTSTTDVMSQNAVGTMVFAYPISKEGVRIGSGCRVVGTQQVAIGGNAYASGEASIAIGYGMAQQYSAQATGSLSVAIGSYARATAKSAIALGDRAYANVQGVMSINSGDSQGYNSSNYRLLSGVYDGQSAHDAATYGQLDTRLGGLTLVSISQTDYDNLQTYDPNTLYVITGA